MYSIRDFYKDYRRACRKNKTTPRCYTKYKEYVRDVFAEVFRKIVRDSWHFVLPYGLGEFYIKKVKPKRGHEHHINNHTFRQMFKFVWDRSYTHFDNSKYYHFYLLDGKEKLHKKYNVGRLAIRNFYFEMGKDPKIKMIKPYSKPVKRLQEPTYEQQYED